MTTITQEKDNTFRYLLTEFGKDGWVDVNKSRPIPFDLVLLKTSKGREFVGWWNKIEWDGYRLKHSDQIIEWKRMNYVHF
jgi:hypothetical protein